MAGVVLLKPPVQTHRSVSVPMCLSVCVVIGSGQREPENKSSLISGLMCSAPFTRGLVPAGSHDGWPHGVNGPFRLSEVFSPFPTTQATNIHSKIFKICSISSYSKCVTDPNITSRHQRTHHCITSSTFFSHIHFHLR
jgi:hypothetical protein